MDDEQRYVAGMSTISPTISERLSASPEFADQDHYLLEVLRAGPSGSLDRLLRADLLTYLPEDVLVKVDRASMAHGLEARSPLLDQELVEFAARLPLECKIRGHETKVLLREVAHTLLPGVLVDRPKMGFGVPLNVWFTNGLGDAFNDLVLGGNAISGSYLDLTEVRRLLAAHRRGDSRQGHALWQILMFEQWARTWLRAGG